MKKILLFLLIFIAFSNAYAIDPYYSDKERGWYFREEPPQPLIEEEPEPELPQPKQEAKVQEPEQPKPFSSKWFKQNLDTLKETAIDEPTPENVSAYYYAQRVAMDKAQRFAQVAAQVVTADPFLDQNSISPMSVAGKSMVEKQASINTDNILSQIAQKTGIWFFFRSDCSFCHSQAKILKALESSHHFKIMAISIDGLPIGPEFPNYKVDAGQAKMMGVETTPTLMMVTPPNKIVNLGEGFIPYDELKIRIVNQAGANGTITDDQYSQTRLASKPLVPSNVGSDITSNDLSTPAKLKQYLNNATKRK